MPDGIRDADGAALRHAQEHESLKPQRVDDRLHVTNPCIEGKVRALPIREAAPPFIVPHVPVKPREFLDPVPPHRAIQIELDVTQPVGRLHERGTLAGRSTGDSYTVIGRTETDLLFQSTLLRSRAQRT